MPRVLIIEDELAIAEAVQMSLSHAGYESDIVAYGAQGVELASSKQPSYDLVILDVGLPDINGFEVARRLRIHQSSLHLPILFLTAHSQEIDRVLGLELGGGDYMTKPFSLRELVTRARLLMQRQAHSLEPASAAKTDGAQVALGFSWHHLQAWVTYNNQPLELTLSEFRLLTQMLSQPQRVFSRQQLLDALRGEAHPSGERTIDTHVKTLRAKLRAHHPQADKIRTHRGLGYSCS
jgi:two-component system, OmpR family, catabolic regulation response regulator CreB